MKVHTCFRKLRFVGCVGQWGRVYGLAAVQGTGLQSKNWPRAGESALFRRFVPSPVVAFACDPGSGPV